jgi:hypothetical protein
MQVIKWLVLGTTGSSLLLLYHQQTTTALTVWWCVSIGGDLNITTKMRLTGTDTDNIYIGQNFQQKQQDNEMCR